MAKRERYGLEWDEAASDLEIEMTMIKKGGSFKIGNKPFGLGNPYHYEQMRKQLWPELDDHRWHRICRDEILKNKVTVLMGPGSSGKTHEASWIYLCEYFCFPHETCVLVSSTDMRGLRLRVWGEITMLWERAVNRFDFLPGHLLDSRIAITTDDLEDGDVSERTVRDMRKGLIGIPTVQNGKFVGLGKWIGIKQKKVRLIADEAAAMAGSFLSAFANLNKNEDFRAIVLGNPNDPLDPLGRAAEPRQGWTEEFLEPDKTTVWDTKFMDGRCVNLIGTDSPNFDQPGTRYKYLISEQKIKETLSFFPKDSVEYYSQCVGTMRISTLARRVITRAMCSKFGAMDAAIWETGETVKIGALDSAYGGDRCVCGYVEFGRESGGKYIINIKNPVIVPISVKSSESPEDQISVFVKQYCEQNGIAATNFFHDSTGRGSLGTSLARTWSSDCNPVEFGGKPTNRPVSLDLYKVDKDTGERRLVRCDEYYGKFVTELWFSVRYAIEAGQVRGLPEDVMEEGCLREWSMIKNERRDVETKIEMKERIGRSPDLFDWLSICVEGCRRKGFQISKLAQAIINNSSSTKFQKESKAYSEMLKSRQLQSV